MSEWVEIEFNEFVDLSQKYEVTNTGIIAPNGYWIEWGKKRSIKAMLRYESEPNAERMDLKRMDRLYKRKGA